MSDAIPAATLIVIRDRTDGPAELLMVQRAASMAFAAGAWVFPGGRVDPADHALARTIAPDREDAPARIAAIRETLEETGVAIGFDARLTVLAAMREQLHTGRPFADVLAAAGVTLDFDALVPFARWRPAHRPTRVFDTMFYIARAPLSPAATVDATENVRLAWITASDLLARADAGDATVIFPTRCNLERFARFHDFAAASRDARAHPVRTITPFVERRDGVDHLCIPEGLGYPITVVPLATAVRG